MFWLNNIPWGLKKREAGSVPTRDGVCPQGTVDNFFQILKIS